VAALITLCLTANASATINLRITQGERDTVTKSKHYLVGVTDPGTVATVNGSKVKVYKTGAFGAEIKLSEGHNTINILLENKGEKLEKQLSVYYDAHPKKQERKFEAERLCERLFFVETKQDAFLQYGDGSDRLGGNKMGYLDEGICLKVVGMIGNLYKVELSENRFAYIPIECTQPTFKETAVENTSSIRATNTGKCDRITLSIPSKHAYTTWTELDPTTINVLVYGATNNTNWLVQMPDLEAIEYIDTQQIEGDVFKIVIKLKEKHCWGYTAGYMGGIFTIDVKHTPALTLAGMTVGIDAGHGGPESFGAVSETGIHEADVNLDIVNCIKTLLEKKGAKVVLSRSGDYGVTMSDRKKTFKDANVDIVISIHNNAGGSPLSSLGTSTYYKHITNRELAETLLDRMMELGLNCYGLVGNFNFALNGPTEYPNALVECLFMSSLPEEELIADPAFRKKIASKVVAGLEDYLKKVASDR